MPDPSPIDLDQISAQTGLSPEDSLDLLRTYAKSSVGVLEKLRHAVVSNDTASAVRHAHTLAGGALMVGLTELGELAKQAESALRARLETDAQVFIRIDHISRELNNLATRLDMQFR